MQDIKGHFVPKIISFTDRTWA